MTKSMLSVFALVLAIMLMACGPENPLPIGDGSVTDGRPADGGVCPGGAAPLTSGAVYDEHLPSCYAFCTNARRQLLVGVCEMGGGCVCGSAIATDASVTTDAVVTDTVTTDAAPADVTMTDATRPDGCVPTVEACNGLDDDCDGLVDEIDRQPVTETCRTSCAPQMALGTVCRSGGWTCECGSTPDAGTDATPATCSGTVGASCNSGGTGACIRPGVTVCMNGSVVCNATPGAPSTETCDGIDNNCNGLVDELDAQPATDACRSMCGARAANMVCRSGGWSCSCGELPMTMCGTQTCGVGACQRSVNTCVSGMMTCTPGTPAASESCNDGVDNNCNGLVDEGCTTTCVPMTEVCNNRDDNCNGQTDELGTTSCGVGACRRTVTNCIAGVTQTCVAASPATSETCGNNVDDDCDGLTDEGCTTTCTPTGAETCNNRDDNCDGTVDNGLGTTSCGVGACRRTVDNCSGGVTQSCTPGTPASSETCGNGVDDDCDGLVDENCSTSTAAGYRYRVRVPNEFFSRVTTLAMRDHWFDPVTCQETGNDRMRRDADGYFTCTTSIRRRWVAFAFSCSGGSDFNCAMPRGVRATGTTCPSIEAGGVIQVTPISASGVAGSTDTITSTGPSDDTPNEPCRSVDPGGSG